MNEKPDKKPDKKPANPFPKNNNINPYGAAGKPENRKKIKKKKQAKKALRNMLDDVIIMLDKYRNMPMHEFVQIMKKDLNDSNISVSDYSLAKEIERGVFFKMMYDILMKRIDKEINVNLKQKKPLKIEIVDYTKAEKN